MSKSTTLQVLETVNKFMSEQQARCELLDFAVKGMLNDEDVLIGGADISIRRHLSDMMHMTEHPQRVVMEHIEQIRKGGGVNGRYSAAKD